MVLPTSPREVALDILSRLFSVEPSVGASGDASFHLPDFQREGVERVRRVLRRRDGAILADSVGLGKTYIAMALVEETLRAGGDAVVIVPAATRGMWREKLRRLNGLGGGWRLLSHTQLARGVRVPHGQATAPRRLIVVDEAHRFRNPRTLRYGALSALIGAESRVLLITATPVNNHPADLLHLVRLFARDDAFRDAGVPSLVGAFRIESGPGPGAERSWARPGGAVDDARVAAVVRSVVVRRTRAMIAARFEGGEGGEGGEDGEAAPTLRFPGRGPPHVVRFEDPALPRLVAAVDRLELPAYDVDPSAPGAAAALLRLGLLKRLDSSPAAFAASLARLEQVTRTALDAALAGRVLSPSRGGASRPSGDLDPLQLSLGELVASPAPPTLDLEALTAALRRDLDLLRSLARQRAGGDCGGKLDALHRLLDELTGEKVLVFTEYRDTAESLWRALAGRLRVGRVDGGGAWLGTHRAGRRTVVERFAPRSNGRSSPPPRERVDVLIATDVLAEGLNLQDARHVVSYDLPWNPVRLLQRIGRVDRLGSLHAEVEVYLFAPASGLEALLGLTRRLRTKLGDIATVVGAEHADALLDSLTDVPDLRGAGRGGAVPDAIAAGVLDRIAVAQDDPMEALRTLWLAERSAAFRGSVPPAGATAASRVPEPRTRHGPRACHAPQACLLIPARHPAAGLRWVLLVEGRPDPELLEMDTTGALRGAGPAAAAALELALTSPTPCSSGNGDPPDPLPLETVRDHVRATAALTATPAPLRSHEVGARLARRIRRGLARAGAAATSTQIARADALLRRLAVPLSPAEDAAARALLRGDDPPGLTALLVRVENALGSPHRSTPPDGPGPHGPRSDSTSATPPARVLAALRVRIAEPPSRS